MRCAVFVDPGYLFAGGTEVLSGTIRPRRDTALHIEMVIKQEKDTAEAMSNYLKTGILPPVIPPRASEAAGIQTPVVLSLENRHD